MKGMINPDINVVKMGTWLYGGVKECEIRIVQHDILYGTGDSDDPLEIAADRELLGFYVFYETPGGEPRFSGGESALTLEDAMGKVEKMIAGDVTWSTDV